MYTTTTTGTLPKSNWDTPNYTWTTSASTISGLSGMTINASGNVLPSYSINFGNTSLETKDVEFIHKLQELDPDVAVALGKMIEQFKKQNNKIQEKEEYEMDIMKNFHFGPCGDRAKISPIGIAIKNNNGEWVSYDKEKHEIINVDLLNFGDSNFVYMIPVAIKDIAEGDAVIHNKHIMFVKKVRSDGVTVVDITDGEYKKILPTKSMFGFDFITKVVSVMDLSKTEASADNPFGNLLPFLLLNGNKNDNVPLAMMMMNGGQLDMSNPLMIYVLMAGSPGSDTSLLPLLMMMSNKN